MPRTRSSERGALADRVKDSGAGCLFPQLADERAEHLRAQEYPVTWIPAQNRRLSSLDCPYREARLEVCQVGAAHPPHQVRLAGGTAR